MTVSLKISEWLNFLKWWLYKFGSNQMKAVKQKIENKESFEQNDCVMAYYLKYIIGHLWEEL